MPDETAPPAGRRSGRPPLSVEEERGPPSKAIPAPLLLGYFDLAVRGTLEYERFARVYLSPWWEIPDVPSGTRAWKRAILERIPLRGAEHWGHLYLVVQPKAESGGFLSILTRPAIGTVVAPKPHETRLPLREGDQSAELIVQPRTPAYVERLDAFAREVEIRFRRQMD